MILSLKELFIVSLIAAVIFRLAKPVALLFMAADDFSRRRNAWYLLTAAAFLSPNFWLFAIVAIPVMVISGRKDTNPGALYLMLLDVVPPIGVPVPMIGMQYLFIIDNHLLLSFAVLAPAALRIVRSKDRTGMQGFKSADFCLLAYGILSSVLYLHDESPDGGVYPGSFTESARRVFVFYFSLYIPYFTFSRGNTSAKLLTDSMAAFCLDCALLSGVAVFESMRGWLLFGEMPARWGIDMVHTPYLVRGTSLRAMVSTGHAMALGYILVVGFGFWLYLQTRVQTKRPRVAGVGLFWAGLFAAYTRGAWIGGAAVYFLFTALRPNPFTRLFKATAVAAIGAIALYLSPLGEKISSVLPFLGGTVDKFNVDYRQRLWDISWGIIQASPIFGDQGAMLKMQNLKQGEGIVDLVNAYVGILLSSGFAGLFLFLCFALIPLFQALSCTLKFRKADPDMGLLGASLVSCILAMLLLLENGSFIRGPEKLYYALIGLTAAYAYLGATSRKPLAQFRGSVGASTARP